MAQTQVKLKSGQVVPMSYPDDWSTAQIEQAIHEGFPDESLSESSIAPTPFNSSSQPESDDRDEGIRNMTGFKGLAAETLLNLSNAMKSSVLFGKDLPSMLKESAKAEEERPLRPYIATAAGLADIGKSTFNAPHDLNQFLARKKLLPKSLGDIGDLIPHIPEDTGVSSLFGLDKPQPEDRLYKGLSAALALGAPSELGALKALEGGKAPGRILPKHLEQKISREKNLLDISGKRLDKFKEALESHPEYRSAKPSTLRRNAGDLEIDIKALEPATKILQKEVPEIPKAPDTAKMNRMAKADVTQASEALSKGLGEGRRLHREGGQEIIGQVEDIRKAASKKFNDTRDYFSQHEIHIDKSDEINTLKDELGALKAHYKDIPGYEEGTPDVRVLEKQLNALETPETIKATDVLDTYQTLHKLAKDAHDKIYERGSNLTKIEKTQLQSLASKYESMADSMGNVLENVGDKNGLKMLQDAKASWKEYASLYGNPTFQYLEKHKALHPSTMANLELGTRGNELLNSIVDKNPQLRQTIFGQKYAAPGNHKSLLRPNEVNDRYLSQLPEVNDLVEAFRNASETANEVKSTATDLKAEHKELSDSIKQVAEEQQIRQDAIANISKYQQLMDKKTKAANLVKNQMNKDVARGEKIDSLEAQLKQIESDRNKFKKLLGKAAKILYRYGGIKSALGH